MLAKILYHLVSDSQFTIIGDPSTEQEYANQVIWHDDRPQPSWADVESARPTVQTKIANKAAENARAHDFRNESDPLFFGWQRGENTEQEWLDKVAEIRARHPYA